MKKRKGQSLLEVLGALAIILMVIGFAQPYYPDFIEGGNISKARGETSQIANNIVRYKYELGKYPDDLKALNNAEGLYKPSGDNKIPEIDPWGKVYFYQKNDTKGFAIWSSGPDKVNDSGNGQSGINGDDAGLYVK